jgi:hypothetical protein
MPPSGGLAIAAIDGQLLPEGQHYTDFATTPGEEVAVQINDVYKQFLGLPPEVRIIKNVTESCRN